MREHFECPVCGAEHWDTIRAYRYSAGEHAERGRMNDYITLRRRILFEVWFPGAANVSLDSVLCLDCGFMAYTPRPSEADIDQKYRFLQVEEKNIGGQKADPNMRVLDKKRGASIFKSVTRYVKDGPKDVLDFGGGDGKLLQTFLAHGYNCGLVDYNVQPLEGVIKLGNTLDEVAAGRFFDIIIASHIIEHLAEPGETVNRLASYLPDGGLIYAEVPLGIWNGIGIELDPVTHINFFMKYSFRRLFEERGFDVLHCRQRVGVYNRRNDVVELVGRKTRTPSKTRTISGPAEARRLNAPSPLSQICRRLRLRRYPTLDGLLRKFGLKTKR